MRRLLDLCDLHVYVVVGFLSLPMSIVLAGRSSAFPSIALLGLFGAVVAGTVLVFGFLALCPFELGFKGIIGWCVVNLVGGTVLAAVILACTSTAAIILRTLRGAIA